MNLLQILLIILGSSVIATLITKIWDFFENKKKIEEKRYQEFYAPFKLYLTFLISIEKIMKELEKTMKKVGLKESKKVIYQQKYIDELRKQLGKNPLETKESKLLYQKRIEEIAEKIIEEGRPGYEKLYNLWSKYAEKIFEIVEKNPNYIKKEDFDLIKSFVDAYIAEEYLIKSIDKLVYLKKYLIKNEEWKLGKAISDLKEKFL